MILTDDRENILYGKSSVVLAHSKPWTLDSWKILFQRENILYDRDLQIVLLKTDQTYGPLLKVFTGLLIIRVSLSYWQLWLGPTCQLSIFDQHISF